MVWAATVQDQNVACAIIGDFNLVLGAHGKRGGRSPKTIACEEFTAFTNVANLMHMSTHGVEYTWSNGRADGGLIEVRLDRVIHNAVWL